MIEVDRTLIMIEIHDQSTIQDQIKTPHPITIDSSIIHTTIKTADRIIILTVTDRLHGVVIKIREVNLREIQSYLTLTTLETISSLETAA